MQVFSKFSICFNSTFQIFDHFKGADDLSRIKSPPPLPRQGKPYFDSSLQPPWSVQKSQLLGQGFRPKYPLDCTLSEHVLLVVKLAVSNGNTELCTLNTHSIVFDKAYVVAVCLFCCVFYLCFCVSLFFCCCLS